MRPPLPVPTAEIPFVLSSFPVWHFGPGTQFVGHREWDGIPTRNANELVLGDGHIDLTDRDWVMWEELNRRGFRTAILLALGDARFESDYYARTCIGIPGPSGPNGNDFFETPGDGWRPPQSLVNGFGIFVVAANPNVAILAIHPGPRNQYGGYGTVAMRDSDTDEFELPIGIDDGAICFNERPIDHPLDL